MVAEYLERLYLPAADGFRRRQAYGLQLATELVRWKADLAQHWSGIHLGNCEVVTQDGKHSFSVHAYLGEMSPATVAVQLYAEGREGRSSVCHSLSRGQALSGAAGGYCYVGEVLADRPATDYTPRVVPSHPEAIVPNEARYITWREA
jgi:starch phosphorylase